MKNLITFEELEKFVADFVAEKEFDECLNKAKASLAALKINLEDD